LYPIQKKSETGGILDAEEKRHFRTFARNLCAALAAHRIRVSARAMEANRRTLVEIATRQRAAR
jgi:hypothetical protein